MRHSIYVLIGIVVLSVLFVSSTGHARHYSNRCRWRSCQAAPTPTPTPTPTPAPDPVQPPDSDPIPSPTTACDVIVNQGQSLQGAENATDAGETLCLNGDVFDGVTIHKGITITTHPDRDQMAEIHGRVWVNSGISGFTIIENLDISDGTEGIRINSPTLVRYNRIHHNDGQGILITSTPDVQISDNIIEDNGLNCTGSNARHCHGIYFSNYQSVCTEMVNELVSGNIISNHPGAGVNVNNQGCQNDYITISLQTNMFIDNGQGFVFYQPGDGSYADVRDNTVRHNGALGSGNQGYWSSSDRNGMTFWTPRSWVNSNVEAVNTFIGTFADFVRFK